MLFSSFPYIFCFLPVVVVGYWMTARLGDRPARAFLIAASLVFYALGDWRGIPYLLLAAVGNYWLAARISASSAALNARVNLLRAGIALNVAQLLVVKYWVFLLGAVGVESTGRAWHVPLGISFFTLIQIMYLMDCYEGLIEAHRFDQHLLFSSFFPYVTMGPLVHSREVGPSLFAASTRKLDSGEVARGAELFIFGLFKKVVFAQSLASLSDTGWGLTRPLSGLEAWVTVIAFAFELYFDFSGYTDMALGSAALLGVRLPENFAAPYNSTSIIVFWKRWHITLSSFITTYLYTPAMRLRRRPSFGWAMGVTVVSMVVAGLWHGAAWTFVVFGLAHGIALALNHVWRRRKLAFPKWLGWLLTFLFVAGTLVLFRARDLSTAVLMFGNLIGRGGRGFDVDTFFGSGPAVVRGFVALIASASCLLGPTSQTLVGKFQASYRRVAWVVAVALIALVFMNSLVAKEFIYRDF
jgi:alginate O-acetyltransferase complex protein AlgI